MVSLYIFLINSKPDEIDVANTISSLVSSDTALKDAFTFSNFYSTPFLILFSISGVNLIDLNLFIKTGSASGILR